MPLQTSFVYSRPGRKGSTICLCRFWQHQNLIEFKLAFNKIFLSIFHNPLSERQAGMTQAYEMLKDVETKELVEQERVSRFEDLVSRLSLSDDEQDALEESWKASYHADPKPLQINGIFLPYGCPADVSCDRVWACPVFSGFLGRDRCLGGMAIPWISAMNTYSRWLYSRSHSDFRRSCCMWRQVFTMFFLDYLVFFPCSFKK